MIGNKRLVVGLVVACVVTFAIAVGSVQGMELAVRNASVYPEEGNWSDYFNYSVNVRFYKGIEIELWIYHPGENKWKPCETQKYNASNGTWQTLWWNIQPFSPGCKGKNSSYEFWWNKEVLEIEGRKTFEGPHIIEEEEIKEEFKNATVKPVSGYYNTSFTYSVEVKLNKEEEIALEIFNISSYEWKVRGENQSNNKTGDWELLIWPNITNIASADCKGGHSSFRFFFTESENKYESDTIDYPIIYPLDPPLDDANETHANETPKPIVYSGGGGGGGGSSYKPYMLYENANVNPSDCTLKGAIERKTFDYTVEVDKKDILILEIYNPSSNEWEEKGEGEKSELKGEWGKWKHEWTINLTLDKNWAGLCKYRFYPERWEKYASQVYYGPEIKMPSLSEWKEEIPRSDKTLRVPDIDCIVDPKEEKWFKKFTYTAEINHPDRANMTVVLFVYKPGSNEWEPVPWRGDRFNPIINPSDYDERKNAMVSWTVEKEDIFDEKDAGESSKFSRFYIWYWDGWNEADCKKLESEDYKVGPKLFVNREPVYTGFSEITPDPGSTHCVYEYKFGVNDTDDEIVSGLLTVVDPLNKTYTVEGIYERGNFTFVVGPSLNIFTDKKLENYRDTSLFIWDKVPGEDSEKLKRYLVSDLGIDWARKATLTKSSDNLTISISTDNNSAEITMAEDMESATLGTDGAQNYTLRVEKGFCWGDIPGEGNMTLIRFLQEEFDIDWAENATITKSTDNMNISIRKDESFATIRLGAKKEKAILETRDGGDYELTVREEVRREEKVLTIYKMENSKLYIYPESFTSRYRLRYWDEGMWVNGITKENPEEKDSWWFGPLVRLVNVTFEEPKVTPENGTYADDFLYKVYLESSIENTIWLTLTIYDPANPEHSHQTLPEKEIKVLAANERSLARWDFKEIQPYLSKIFGPNDFGKTARYEIAWEDRYGSSGIIKGTGPSIERALPLLSFDQLPFYTIVVLPLLIFVGLLLFGLFGQKGEKGKK